MADKRKPRRNFAAFLTGQADEEIPEAAKPPAAAPSATDLPLIPADEPRRPATRAVRPAQAAPSTPPPVALGPDGEEVPIVALPDYAAPPGVVVSAGYDSNGVEYVFEDDPGGSPLVDPRYDAADRNWVRYRTSWGGFLRIVGLIVVVLFVVVTARNRVYNWIDDQIDSGGDHGEAIPFTIQSGAAVNDVATKLAEAEIINNATVFRYWLRCDVPNGGEITISGFLSCDTEVQFQAGDYELVENMTYEQVVDVLAEGPIVPEVFKVRIPEGLTVAQLVERLLDENDLFNREELLEALSDPALFSTYLREGKPFWPHEGLLFPAFYDVPEQDLANERLMVGRMSSEMDARVERLIEEAGGLPPEAIELAFDEYDIVTIASLIEEEAKVDGDRAKIARVIYNRLTTAGWTLGIDASVCYGAGVSCQDITTEQLNDTSNRWNTRANAGLPFTPIAAPGEESLHAALNPEAGAWFYYVLTDHGGVTDAHTFAETDAEFQAAKAVCQDLGYCQ